jgi:large subunit ribosomal protein L21
MYAIVRAGGKQLKVSPGDIVRIEKPSEKVSKGQKLSLDSVIFAGEAGKEPKDPQSVTIKATVLTEGRSRKALFLTKEPSNTVGRRVTGRICRDPHRRDR